MARLVKVCFFLIFCSASALGSSSSYTVRSVGGGLPELEARSVNDSGEVLLYDSSLERMYIWSDERGLILLPGTTADPIRLDPISINNNGDVLWSQSVVSDGVSVKSSRVLSSDGTLYILDASGVAGGTFSPNDLNDDRLVIGTLFPGDGQSYQAATWEPSTGRIEILTQIYPLNWNGNSDPDTYGVSVSNAGRVVGGIAQSPDAGFFFDAVTGLSPFTVISSPISHYSTKVAAGNNKGQAAGSYLRRDYGRGGLTSGIFIRGGGTFRQYEAPYNYTGYQISITNVRGLSDAGVVVGDYSEPGAYGTILRTSYLFSSIGFARLDQVVTGAVPGESWGNWTGSPVLITRNSFVAIDISDSGDYIVGGAFLTKDGVDVGASPFLMSIVAVDADDDGVLDESDNCPLVPNSPQLDADGDLIGDLCDGDDDNDGVLDEADNCPLVGNNDQHDIDQDGVGDVCDSLIDSDGDGVDDSSDNCPSIPNFEQVDLDSDGAGDTCDPDDDNDSFFDTQDNCPVTPNTDQVDNDLDGLGDVCDVDDDNDGISDSTDNCPVVSNLGQNDTDTDGWGDACDSDDDSDGIDDNFDNCPVNFNPDQSNSDGIGAGDACNSAFDLDSDEIEDSADNCPNTPNVSQGDFDQDGIGDICDNDSDNDGVIEAADICPMTAPCEVVSDDGCSLPQLCPCGSPRQSTTSWRNSGAYVSCVATSVNSFVKAGLLSAGNGDAVSLAAKDSACGAR